MFEVSVSLMTVTSVLPVSSLTVVLMFAYSNSSSVLTSQPHPTPSEARSTWDTDCLCDLSHPLYVQVTCFDVVRKIALVVTLHVEGAADLEFLFVDRTELRSGSFLQLLRAQMPNKRYRLPCHRVRTDCIIIMLPTSLETPSTVAQTKATKKRQKSSKRASPKLLTGRWWS